MIPGQALMDDAVYLLALVILGGSMFHLFWRGFRVTFLRRGNRG